MSGEQGDGWRGRLDALPTSRTCAGCDLCCTVMAVKELGKSPWRACVYLDSQGGCAVWGAHPESCKAFTCLWRRSDTLLPPDLFPADCGFLVVVDQLKTWPTVVKICPDDARPPAWDTPRNRDLFARLAAAWNCSVVVVEQDVRGKLAFAPNGSIYNRDDHPEIFPSEGRQLLVPESDYGPDRRPPEERIAAAQFDWREGAPAD